MTTTTPIPAKIPLKSRLAKKARRWIKIILFAYLLAGILLYTLQTKLIFIGHNTQGTEDAMVQPLPGSEFVHLKSGDGTSIVGLFGKAQLPNGRDDPRSSQLPTVLFFYGNAMCMAYALGEFELFRHSGANCMLIDFPGFGMSGGEPSEQGCYQSAEAAYQHLIHRTDIDTRKIIPAGWSLGSAVAIDLAATHKNDNRIVALITFCSFTSMPDLARCHYPVFPVGLLLKHRFLSEEKLHTLKLPYLLGHGTHDSIIPFRMADRLSAVATESGCDLTRITIDSDHNDFFEIAEPRLKKELPEFLGKFQ